MKTIYKYSIEPVPFPSVWMPADAEILCVQSQGDLPFIWAIVDPSNANPALWQFRMLATGQEFENVGKYVGTFQMLGGRLVFHLFEAAP